MKLESHATFVWVVNLLGIVYQMQSLLRNNMLINVLKFYEVDAAGYIGNTKLILMTK